MKNTLVLKDGSEIKIEPGSSLSDMRVLSDTKSDMLAAWDKLTADNLSEIQIKDSDGLLVVAVLENGYEVHEGAIGDMGKAVSELAEAGGHI